MPVELGSFDAIVDMDWLAKYYVVIVCAEKIVRIHWGSETLIVHGDGSNQGNDTRLNIISCTKMQKFMLKGCQVFLACVTTKETEYKSKKKQLEDVPIIQDFPEVFPKDLPSLPPTRQVEFQIDLVPGAAPVARAPYRLAPAEMKELSEQLQELSDKGFIRPNSSHWGALVLFFKKKDESFRMYIDYRELNKLTIITCFEYGKKIFQKRHSGLDMALRVPSYAIWFDERTGDILRSHEPCLGHEYGIPSRDWRTSERTIQTLKDMLRACAINFGKVWVNHLPLVEFSYNNCYHASNKATPFKALCGRKCRSPVCWAEVGEVQLTGPELVQETTEKII
ncbi:putative reverse transcriptase domain-containing protein [Tanacetum coccineum]